MCAASRGKSVRTEDEVGPNLDKHALIVDGFREVHDGSWAARCSICREAKRLTAEGKA